MVPGDHGAEKVKTNELVMSFGYGNMVKETKFCEYSPTGILSCLYHIAQCQGPIP